MLLTPVYPSASLFPGPTVFPYGATTPAERQATRASLGLELARPELGNGILFTFISGSPPAGVLSYAPQLYSYDLEEAALDGGVLTNDWDLAVVLRRTGLFTETQL